MFLDFVLFHTLYLARNRNFNFLLRKTYLSDGQKQWKLMKYEELFIAIDEDRCSAASSVTQNGLKRDVTM